MDKSLNKLIDDFICTFNNDIKQRDKDWYKLMGTTVGGSEIAALMGLSPYSNFYKIVESKIEICKGIKSWNSSDTLSCWWGTIFEDIITRFVEIDLGNPVKGTSICIQKYEGHRNSPDGYVVVNFYKVNDTYNIWTTDLPKSLISLTLIMLLEFKCPITRKTTGDIPKYYKPQVLSGLSVSPIAHKGLFIDAVFKKCSIDQLGNNTKYDSSFHKKTDSITMPIAWGVLPIYISISKIEVIKNIYYLVFDMIYDANTNDIIDLGDVEYDIFYRMLQLINEKQLIVKTTTVMLSDGRGDSDLISFSSIPNYKLFALLPWKLIDVSYIPVDREPNFLENIYPTIQRVHELVADSLKDDSYEKQKISNVCDTIYN